MKRNLIIACFVTLFTVLQFSLMAQAPYKHSVGVTIGTTQAIAYKTFVSDHFAIQMDLGTKYCYVYGNENWALEFAPNFMYEGRLYRNLYGFVGGGGSLGYTWNHYLYFNDFGLQSGHNHCKAGLNGMFGLEYKLAIPLLLQLDFRPGYRCVFNRYFAEHIFDWGLNFGVRYTF